MSAKQGLKLRLAILLHPPAVIFKDLAFPCGEASFALLMQLAEHFVRALGQTIVHILLGPVDAQIRLGFE